MTTTNDPIAELERTTGSNWSAIKSAAAAATAKRRTLVDELTKMKLVPPDSTFVMFGSLARDEVTAGSDLDWTLLIDGQSDTRHLDVTKAIKVLRVHPELQREHRWQGDLRRLRSVPEDPRRSGQT